jgi:hypothetical protein
MPRLLLELPPLDPTSRWLLMGGTVVLIFFAVLRPMMRKKDPLARPRLPASLSDHRSVEREMSNLLVELSEMARQITGQLDTRAAKLELLIKEADEKIARLGASTGPPSPSRYAMAAENPRIERETEPEPRLDPAHAEVYSLADQGRSPREIAAQLSRPDGEIELILALRSAR